MIYREKTKEGNTKTYGAEQVPKEVSQSAGNGDRAVTANTKTLRKKWSWST